MGSGRKRKLDGVLNGDDGPLTTIPADATERFDLLRTRILSEEQLDKKFFKDLLNFLTDSRDDEDAVRTVSERCDLKFMVRLLCRFTCTQSKADLYIFDALKCLERVYHVNMRPLTPLVFGEKAHDYYEQLIRFGQSLHQAMKPDKAEFFDELTMWTTLIEMTKSELSSKRRRSMYDPQFVLQTLYHLVGAGSELSCVKFITSNALSFTFASTSFQSPDLRALAYLTLARFGKLLGDLSAEKFEARSLYVMLITKLRNSIEDLNPRICHPVSHFFARVSKLMLHPEDPVYAPVMSFLTMTPTISLEAVPEFYKLFYSSSTQFYQNERRWMLKLCAEAMLDSYDYSVMSKNYIIEAALALFTSPMADQVSKSLILRLLENCFSCRSVSHELQRRCNVATWIPQAMQCVGITRQEQFALCRLFVTLCSCASARNETDCVGRRESEASFFLLQVNAHQILTVIDSSDDYVKQQMHDIVQTIADGKIPAKEEVVD